MAVRERIPSPPVGSRAAGSGHRGSQSQDQSPRRGLRAREHVTRHSVSPRPGLTTPLPVLPAGCAGGPRARSPLSYPGLISCRSRPKSQDTTHFQPHPTGKIWKPLTGGGTAFDLLSPMKPATAVTLTPARHGHGAVPSLWPEQGFMGATVSSVSPSRDGDTVKTDAHFLRQIKVRKGKIKIW